MYNKVLKRVFDFILALNLVILSLPVMIVVAFVVRIFVDKNFIFSQERPGLECQIFKIYKFKTMSDERDENGELLPDELRLNKVGKIIRSLSLDELPQLFNVLRGDMSFIGPRPLLVEYLPLYSQEQNKRHSVRPGITGLAQIKGRNAISFKNKFRYDTFYARNLSFFMDLKIVFLTIIKVVKKEGVSKKGMATTEKFNGKN